MQEVAGSCDLSTFSCGESSLDDWLVRRALPSEGRTARTYVVCDDDRVVAYYCLATAEIERAALPRRMKHGLPDPVPVFKLGRLAVDQQCQGQGIGRGLMSHCFQQCAAAATFIGARGLIVHPLHAGLLRSYRDLGFLELPGVPDVMLMPIETIVQALE